MRREREVVVEKASKERPYWMAVTLLLLALSGLLLFSMLDTRRQLDEARQQLNAAGQSQGQPQNDSSGGTVGTDHITVQHVLIGFKDAVGFGGNAPVKAQGRTQEQAKTLAYQVLDQAKGGADFDALVTQHTDDSPPGIYGMANSGITPATGEFSRDGMVPAFGNVGFELEVGEYGIADYDPQNSPYGYHVIKRTK